MGAINRPSTGPVGVLGRRCAWWVPLLAAGCLSACTVDNRDLVVASNDASNHASVDGPYAADGSRNLDASLGEADASVDSPADRVGTAVPSEGSAIGEDSAGEGASGDAFLLKNDGTPGSCSTDCKSHIDAGVDAEANFDAEAGLAADEGDGGLSLLGSAKNYAVLAGSTVTITPAPTTIVGDVGVSPGTSIMTLPPGQPLGAVHAGDPVAAQAQSDLTFAYNTLAGTPCLPANNRSGVDLGGLTLPPAVYCFNSSAGLTGNLVLDAQGDPNAVWVFQIASTLITATEATVAVIGGGSACNVYWQVGSSATLGTGTQFIGNIVALTSVTLVTNSTVVGRVLARNGAVTLDSNAISAAVCQ